MSAAQEEPITASKQKGSKRLRRTRDIEEEVKEAAVAPSVDTKMKNVEEEVKGAAASSVSKKSPAKN